MFLGPFHFWKILVEICLFHLLCLSEITCDLFLYFIVYLPMNPIRLTSNRSDMPPSYQTSICAFERMTKTKNNAAVLRAHTQDCREKHVLICDFVPKGFLDRKSNWFLDRKIFFLRNTTNCISFESELNADFYRKIFAKNSRFTKL